MNCQNRDCVYKIDKHDFLYKTLIISLAPVIYGVKPIHLVCLSEEKEFDILIFKIKYYLNLFFDIRYKKIKCRYGRVKVLFYNVNKIEVLLNDKSNCIFLESKGHCYSADYKYFIDFFSKKLEYNKIPHEIGLFFGYPLKDVVGFIEHPNKYKTASYGWQVYGDTIPSRKIYNLFENAKLEMRDFLESA
jgi:hypothetical protein